VILTSHMMEEAEALSTKMGIMVKGGIFKCFGSSQHIKDKFGDGYEVDIKITLPSHDFFKEMGHKEFADCVVKDTDDKDGVGKINVRAALKQIHKQGSTFIADQIRQDILIAYK